MVRNAFCTISSKIYLEHTNNFNSVVEICYRIKLFIKLLFQIYDKLSRRFGLQYQLCTALYQAESITNFYLKFK